MTSQPLTLDELVALNEEIAALVRAGVPLERALVGVGGDVRGRLGRVAEAIGRRMSSEGRSLPEALEAESGRVPDLYRAVVEAGLRAGRLPAALEGLSGFARGMAELRRAIGLSLLYPALVLAMAYGLFVAFVVALAPRIEEAFRSLELPTAGASGVLARIGEAAPYWAPIGPALMALAAVAWSRSGRALVLQSGRLGGLVARLPWMRGLVEHARASLFAEMLAILVEHRVPLPDALSLAAETVGSPRLRRVAEAAAEATSRGDDLRSALPAGPARDLPPMLRWLIVNGPRQGGLPESLRLAARTYHQRALDRAELIRGVMPTLLLIVIGGSAALLYGLTLFIPFTDLLEDLAR